MSSIRTVNMVWERRIRGVYPMTACSLDDAGTIAVAAPRPLEARLYDITRISADGGSELRSPFSAQTLLKLEVSAASDDCIGITADALYLFQNGVKGRFLGDRRVTFVDAGMSENGQLLAAGFSDMAGVSFAVVYGRLDGHVIWLREAGTRVTAVAIARNGSRVLFGSECGTLNLVDAARRDVWEFGQPSPIRSLAVSTDGQFIAYGTAAGYVGLVTGDGSRKWEAQLPGEITSLALAGDGSLCTAVCASETGGSHLFCINDTGHVAWDYDAERRIMGVALSPNGKYVATGGRDGTMTLYEVVPRESASASGQSAGDARTMAAELAAAGDVAGALETMRHAIDAETDVALCEGLSEQAHHVAADALAAGSERCAQGDHAAAIRLIAPILACDPLNVEAAEALRLAREGRAAELIAVAECARATGDLAGAEGLLREAIGVAPFGAMAGRRALAELRSRSASEADAEADRLLTEGDLVAAVAALERAQSMARTAERARKLDTAHTAMELHAGMEAYNDKRYSEAIFQFKKVLARDPANSEAKRHLNFAVKFSQDATNDTLTDRFSKLE